MHTSEQEKMLEEYTKFQTGMLQLQVPYKQKFKNAAEQGLLIFVKWGLALVLAFLTLQFFTNVVSGSQNGTNAVLYLNELQNKGYLPKVVNGSVPPKVDNVGTTNAKP